MCMDSRLKEILRCFSRPRKAAATGRVVPQFLIVGLGNPGREYELTRHNIGFMVVEEMARRWNMRFKAPRRQVRLAFGEVAGAPVALLEPLAYMNLSGKPVALALIELALSPTQMLVIHDDVDLPLGRIRLRLKGSAAGHKGVQSIIDSLGTTEFARLRIGIGRPSNGDVKEYVLTPFSREEEVDVSDLLVRAISAVESYLSVGIEAAMNMYNR